jgi:hypothetical protein
VRERNLAKRIHNNGKDTTLNPICITLNELYISLINKFTLTGSALMEIIGVFNSIEEQHMSIVSCNKRKLINYFTTTRFNL